MIRIGFLTPDLHIRGTCVAVYDYAHFNEVLLNNKSIILTREIKDRIALKHFQNRFQVVTYNSSEDLNQNLKKYDIDILYHIKYGRNDTYMPTCVFNIVHCVFDMTEQHGDVYAGISQSLALKFNSTLYVPHMCSMKYCDNGNFREQYKIPINACVFGRYGGMDTFNLPWIADALLNILNINENIYFFFMNTPKINHPRIIYHSSTSSVQEKQQFIHTCDAMIVPESLGHSFGLSCAEFASQQKPLIVYNGPDLWNTAHVDVLGDKGIYFTTQQEFEECLCHFYNNKDNYKIKNKDLNAWKYYSPQNVMKLFHEIFIQPYLQKKNKKIILQ